MKKIMFATLIAMAASAQATDVGVSVGRDYKYEKDVTVLSVGTQVKGFGVAAQYGRVEGVYDSYGVSVNKSYVTGPVVIVPHVGAAYNDGARAVKSGYVATAGVSIEYPLNKTVSITTDFSRRFDVTKDTSFEGNMVTVGLKGSF